MHENLVNNIQVRMDRGMDAALALIRIISETWMKGQQ